jgi:hypothetical protein
MSENPKFWSSVPFLGQRLIIYDSIPQVVALGFFCSHTHFLKKWKEKAYATFQVLVPVLEIAKQHILEL